MSRKGFTLAEILITLTVIGVVAALTIPTLLQNTNQAEFKAALKKDYGILAQVGIQVANDNGGNLSDAFTNSNSFQNLFLTYFNYIKACNVGDSSCVNPTPDIWKEIDGKTPYPSGGAAAGINNPAYPRVVLNNGALLQFLPMSTSCVSNRLTTNDACGYIELDVNGILPPNITGKDHYSFLVSKTGEIIPMGADKDALASSSWSYFSQLTGYSKTAEYLYQ